MKKTVPIVAAAALAAASLGGYYYWRNAQPKYEWTPVSLNKMTVKTPDGSTEDVTIVSLPRMKSSRQKMILKGEVVLGYDKTLDLKHVLIVTDTGARFYPTNSAYVDLLEKKAMGKIVQVSGTRLERTMFQNLPGIWVDDILKVEDKPAGKPVKSEASADSGKNAK